MAVPFNLPDESDSSSREATQQPPVETAPSTPSRPVAMPQNNNNSHSPQIDNEALVQAFYEALCRCSQGQYPAGLSPASPSGHEHFWFPTPSTSTASSPRSSFRGHSLGSRSHFSEDETDHWNTYPNNNNQPNENNQKKPNNNKITSFVISALQFVIDTLR